MDEVGFKISEITKADCAVLGISDPDTYTRMLTRNRKLAASFLNPLEYTQKGQSPRYHFREAAKLSILSHLAETGISVSEIEKISKALDELPLRVLAQPRVFGASKKYLDILVMRSGNGNDYKLSYKKEKPRAGRETRTFDISLWFGELWHELYRAKDKADR